MKVHQLVGEGNLCGNWLATYTYSQEKEVEIYINASHRFEDFVKLGDNREFRCQEKFQRVTVLMFMYSFIPIKKR